MSVTAPVSGSTGILNTASQVVQMGISYVWGGASLAGFDCSGLTQWVYKQNGISIPRTTGGQYSAGQEVPLAGSNGLTYAQPGDLVFFGMENANPASQHVGIILSTAGQGTMIDAPHTGTKVRVDTIFNDAAEPLSGIRRFSTTAPGNTYGSTLTSATLASSSPGALQNPSFFTEAKSVLVIVGGAVVGVVGLLILVKGEFKLPGGIML